MFEKLLEQKGVKTAEVARSTGLNPTVFTDWKKGKSNPKIDKLQKIAEYFGVTVDYLVSGKESMFSDEAAKMANDIRRDYPIVDEVYEKYKQLSEIRKEMIKEQIEFAYEMEKEKRKKMD